MKQIFFTLIKGCVLPLIITGAAYAQSSSSLYVITDTKTFGNSIAAFDEKNLNTYSGEDANAINANAVKSFTKNFKNASDAKWSKIVDGFTATFTADGAENRCYYDKYGNWHFTVVTYEEKKLPKDIRSRVKSIYYDYSISIAQEVHVADKTIYLIHMQGDTCWKTVRVSDEDMEEIETLNKK